MKVDFHVHSTASDGTMSPQEVASAGESFAAMALTDHDNCDGVEDFLSSPCGGCKRFSGLELSIEPGSGFDKFHLVALGIDWRNPALEKLLRRILQGRNDRNLRILENFANLGIEIEPDDIFRYAHGEVLARPHFARWLVDHEYAADISQAFERYLLPESPKKYRCYEERWHPGQEETFSVVHAAGGVCVMAHPKYWRRTWREEGCDFAAAEKELSRLKECGLDAIESLYQANSPEENVAFTLMADRLGLLKSAGSDFHGEHKAHIALGMEVSEGFIAPLLERLKKTIFAFCVLLFAGFSFAAPEPVNVPRLMQTFSGEIVSSKAEWERVRARELLERFTSEVYGRRPKALSDSKRVGFELLDTSDAMEGKALRKRLRCRYQGPLGEFVFPFTVFIPKSDRPAPAFVFICNRSAENVDPDRIRRSEFYPAEEIIARGYATAAFLFSDVAADDAKAGFDQGIFSVVEKSSERTAESWASISAWAWAASRIMDWIEKEPLINSKRVGVVGHSRGGKTALWAAVTDRRFAMACVNNSGCGGMKLNHIDLPKSEPIERITRKYTHWFCLNYKNYANEEKSMDFDQHQLAALVAPRLLAIGSASEDFWAGQLGEWWCAKLASDAWELYGKRGLVAENMPEVGVSQQKGNISYHFRDGRHDLKLYDWNKYLDFADRHGWRK